MRNPRTAAGASDGLAGQCDSPTPIDLQTQPIPANAVAVFAPWSGEAERALRIRIHRARDTATARATRCKHEDARTIYWLAAQMASARVFARMPNDDLKETIDNLARLFIVAGWLERTELPDVE